MLRKVSRSSTCSTMEMGRCACIAKPYRAPRVSLKITFVEFFQPAGSKSVAGSCCRAVKVAKRLCHVCVIFNRFLVLIVGLQNRRQMSVTTCAVYAKHTRRTSLSVEECVCLVSYKPCGAGGHDARIGQVLCRAVGHTGSLRSTCSYPWNFVADGLPHREARALIH